MAEALRFLATNEMDGGGGGVGGGGDSSSVGELVAELEYDDVVVDVDGQSMLLEMELAEEKEVEANVDVDDVDRGEVDEGDVLAITLHSNSVNWVALVPVSVCVIVRLDTSSVLRECCCTTTRENAPSA